MSAWDVESGTKWLCWCPPSLLSLTLYSDSDGRLPRTELFLGTGGVWSKSTMPGQTEGAGEAVLFSPCDEHREQS